SVVRVEEYSEVTGNAQAGVDVSGEAECTLIRTHVRDNGSWGVVSGAGARVTMESCKASGVWSTGARDGAWLTAVDTQIDGKTCGAYASSKGVVLLERCVVQGGTGLQAIEQGAVHARFCTLLGPSDKRIVTATGGLVTNHGERSAPDLA